MKKSVCIALISIIISVILCSCSYGIMQGFYRKNPVEVRASQLKEITPSLNITENGEYCFIVTADLHFGAKQKADLDTFFKTISEMKLRPSFMINLGDIAEHGYKNEYEEFVEKLVTPLEDLGIKTFNVTGNHDLFNSGWDNFTQLSYPYTSFYKFEINDISYYFLDSASGNLSKPQITILSESLQNDTNKKMIFTHFPLYGEDIMYFAIQDTQERNELISLFEKSNVSFYACGHDHRYRKSDFTNFTEVCVPAFLEFGGWVVFTVNQKDGSITFEPLLHQISAS